MPSEPVPAHSTVWRPSAVIKVKVLGLAWRGDALLVAEVRDDAGRLKGCRPLGGTVEFGETCDQALAREFAEELGVGVERLGPWMAVENLFVHEGARGHEILFLADIALDRDPQETDGRIVFSDGGLDGVVARFWPLTAFTAHGPALYPEGLLTLLSARGGPPGEVA